MVEENEKPAAEGEEVLKVDSTVHVPDIPLPAEVVEVVKIQDCFDSAVKLAIVGAGQGGSRIAATFWNLGYRRVCIINTAQQDMAAIGIPEDRKLLIGEAGAGKDPRVAESLAQARYEDILDFMRRSFEDEYDRILICIGAGGGTGAGSVETLIHIARDLNNSLGKGSIEGSKVGVLVALPKHAEGKKVNANAFVVMQSLLKLATDKMIPKEGLGIDSPSTMISPLVVLDNERIKVIYPKLSVKKFWTTANQSVCALLHLFNTIACQDSQYTSFDRADLETVLSSGVITVGATPVPKWKEATDISYAVRDNLRRNILAGGMDLSEGNVAACVVIGSKDVLAEIPQENLEHGFEQLSRILGKGSTVHRGIYQGDKEGLVVYTAIGGLGAPIERLQEIARIGDQVFRLE